jgi:hypothetical protein
MSVLPQITYGNVAFISMDTTKMKYLQTIGIHRIFLIVAAFSVTNMPISSTKKKIDVFKHFYLIF